MTDDLALPTADDVAAAGRALAGQVVRTPLVAAAELGDGDVLLKPELLQRGGSFKLRGALMKVHSLDAHERAAGVVTVSAGNHAIAVALVCGRAGIPATIFMPRTADPVKVARARSAGAAVDRDSGDAAEAFARMDDHVARTGAVVVHPFDDPFVVAGQGTVGAEIVDDRPDVGTVVVPVGGGGLIAGIAIAVKHRAPAARIIGVEPEGAATLTAALAAGGPRPVPHTATLAEALAPPSAGRISHVVARDLVHDVVVLSEDELVAGFRAAYGTCRLAAEVGGAAAIAALVAGRVDATPGPTVLVVSGGNIDPAVAAGLLAQRG